MDLERTMQFIVDNLAAVTVRQEQTSEIIRRVAARQEKADARLTRLERQTGGLQKLVKTGMRMLVDLGATQKRTEKTLAGLTGQVAELTVQVAELAVQQKRTDQKFERWLDSMNKGTNGHKKRSN